VMAKISPSSALSSSVGQNELHATFFRIPILLKPNCLHSILFLCWSAFRGIQKVRHRFFLFLAHEREEKVELLRFVCLEQTSLLCNVSYFLYVEHSLPYLT
jgi:hypothetical protein